MGGHAFAEHVNVHPTRLTQRVREEAEETIRRGDDFRGFAVGSFTTFEAMRRLVNSTISRNQNEIQVFLAGPLPVITLNANFSSETGYEMYLPRYSAKPYLRKTYSVNVFIIRDSRSRKVYRVQTAFPVN